MKNFFEKGETLFGMLSLYIATIAIVNYEDVEW